MAKWFHRSSARREELRRKTRERGDDVSVVQRLRAEGRMLSITVGLLFWLGASAILMLRPEVVAYRPGQWVPHDIVSRVDFAYHDPEELTRRQQEARIAEPTVYSPNKLDVWGKVETELLALPKRVAGQTLDQLAPPLSQVLDAAALAKLQEVSPDGWDAGVKAYVETLRKMNLVVLDPDQRKLDEGRVIRLLDRGTVRLDDSIYTLNNQEPLAIRFTRPAGDNFTNVLFPKVVQYTLKLLAPTHLLDEAETAQARNAAADRVPRDAGNVRVNANMQFIAAGEIDTRAWRLLQAENKAFRESRFGIVWAERGGLLGAVGLLTVALCGYIQTFQPRIARNHARSLGLAVLMLSMLLLAQLTGLGSSPLYVFGIAPTVLVAMITSLAYDRRFAIGVASVHAVLVTFALSQPLSFFLIVWLGAIACCYLLDDVRTRDKLIRVGGGTSLALALGTVVAGLLNGDPVAYVLKNCLYAASAGLGAGFVVLGILPFIEKAFRMTTSMTLLELADVSHPLLRRVAMEAPGTWNHSLQVATLSEEAAEAIGANSLLCRVGAYYHDVGKVSKPDYFIENQQGGFNRHINLNPSVSLLIIIGHVKDGVELAKEYNLPTRIIPFIQQHHGTTLVEFFYNRACGQAESDPNQTEVEEHQYRYPGPKPRLKETAILMLADACESACRAIAGGGDVSPARIESLVHDLSMKRLVDGQFDECDLTMRELELVERSMVKTLLGIYHGRIVYPGQTSARDAKEPKTVIMQAPGTQPSKTA
jgi:putative nucleotidyltransferase with HDIG domain